MKKVNVNLNIHKTADQNCQNTVIGWNNPLVSGFIILIYNGQTLLLTLVVSYLLFSITMLNSKLTMEIITTIFLKKFIFMYFHFQRIFYWGKMGSISTFSC